MVMIAAEADFTRSNLYRYFATREEVFLDILKEDLTEWVVGLDERLGERPRSIREFAERWIDSLLEHPQMLGLLAILSTTLESGSSVAALAAFKRRMATIHRREIAHIVGVFPALTPRAAHRLILLRSSLIVGAFPAMNPTPKQIKAMGEAGVATEPREYRDMMIASVASFMSSLGAGPSQ